MYIYIYIYIYTYTPYISYIGRCLVTLVIRIRGIVTPAAGACCTLHSGTCAPVSVCSDLGVKWGGAAAVGAVIAIPAGVPRIVAAVGAVIAIPAGVPSVVAATVWRARGHEFGARSL